MVQDAVGGEPAEPLEALQQDTVADVQPTSRFGAASDLAVVQHAVLTRDGVVSTSVRLPVFPAGGRFSLTVTVPAAFARLADGGDFTVALLLPRDGPGYRVELVEHSTEHDPQVFDGRDLPLLGGRTAVVWRGNGTDLSGVWEYIRVP